jgi:PAS domain S-box-containing protein
VMAIFARHSLSENLLAELRPIADGLAQWVRRRRAEEELRRSEEELRALADSIPQLAWMAHPDGYLAWYNRRYYAYTGTTPEEMTGWGWKAVHDPQMLPLVIERWSAALRTGEPFEMEFPIRAADGSFRWFLTRANPVRDREGRIVRWFGTNTDMEEVKRAQEALSRAQQELQQHAAKLEQTVAERTAQLSEKIGELEAFSYSISHDMRSPLRAMNGYAILLLDEHAEHLNEDAKHYLERIHKAASRMDLLIQEVLTYSKVTKVELKLEPVDLERLIADACQTYPAFQAPQSGITVKGPLPKVLGHETFLTQIIYNLLGNAVKFVQPGVMPQVLIYAETTEGLVRVWVEDNGIGIDPMHFNRIFEIFGRVYADTIFEGTGIGLAIAKKAVERMNGSIGVESQPGSGSRFWFSLKLAEG